MFYDSQRIVDKNRGRSGTQGVITAARSPWTPTIPTAEPWRSIYLELSVERQQLWDSLSPAARRTAFGV